MEIAFLLAFVGIEFGYIFYLIIRAIPFIQYNEQEEEIGSRNNAELIVCQHNEIDNLHFFHKHIQDQKEIDLQVNLVDDYSTDGSLEKAKELCKNDSNWKLIQNSGDQGKKSAQKEGFLHAEQEWILLTDMDCMPSSSQWAHIMVERLHDADVVLGFAPFFKESGLLNCIQRYDNAWIGVQYASAAIRNNPYMGVGRNMAIKKSVYNNASQEVRGKHLLSGDDDLMIQTLKDRDVKIEFSPNALMYSKAESTYSTWLKQKSRQISTSFHYSFFDQVLLSFSALCSLLPLFLLTAGVLLDEIWPWILLIFHIVISMFVQGKAFRKLGEGDLMFCIPFIQILYGLHLIIVAVVQIFYKKDRWK